MTTMKLVCRYGKFQFIVYEHLINACIFQSFFLAHGPAFKEGYVAPGFDNIQIYNLLCGEYFISYNN